MNKFIYLFEFHLLYIISNIFKTNYTFASSNKLRIDLFLAAISIKIDITFIVVDNKIKLVE